MKEKIRAKRLAVEKQREHAERSWRFHLEQARCHEVLLQHLDGALTVLRDLEGEDGEKELSSGVRPGPGEPGGEEGQSRQEQGAPGAEAGEGVRGGSQGREPEEQQQGEPASPYSSPEPQEGGVVKDALLMEAVSSYYQGESEGE
jgi:hypothetical protein